MVIHRRLRAAGTAGRAAATWARRRAAGGGHPARDWPVWLLTACLLGCAVWLFLGEVQHLPPTPAPFELPWWALAAGFFVAEVAVVNYDFRRGSHSFSMNELPLVFGLFFVPAPELVVAAVAGSGAALIVHRRQLGVKLLFNVGHFALGSCLAVIVFRALTDGDASFTPSTWIAVLVVTLTTSTLSTAAIFLAISLSERRLPLGRLPEQLMLALLTTTGSASLGLIGVGVAWHDPAAAWLLLVPVATFFLAYRGYVLQRQERNSLEFLYDAGRAMDGAPDLATAMSHVLRSTCRTFRAELAQFALLSQHDDAVAVVVTATADAEAALTAEHVPLAQVDDALRRALRSPTSQIVEFDGDVAGAHGRILRQVMVAPLRSEQVRLGTLLVGDRVGSTARFKASQLRLLETLATQISVSLENGRLARSLRETSLRADRERANALVLQRGILPPPLPRVPGASIAVRYVPADAGMEVGGDWYDVMRLPGGEVGVAIGDVLGHDLEAAARMGQARSVLRAYASEGHPPGAVMERLNRLLGQTDTEFIGTCCFLRCDLDSGVVTVTSAGHPPPLLIAPDGRMQPVDVAANLPLGVDEEATFAQTTIAMPPGATLVLFTDGLVESRTLPLDEGLARLARVPADQARGDLEALADRFLAQMPAGPVDDDLTLLLLRHETADVGRAGRLTRSRSS